MKVPFSKVGLRTYYTAERARGEVFRCVELDLAHGLLGLKTFRGHGERMTVLKIGEAGGVMGSMGRDLALVVILNQQRRRRAGEEIQWEHSL